MEMRRSSTPNSEAADGARQVLIFDTLTNQVQPLEPVREGSLGIYVCGVTVYDDSHLGHARTIVVFDVVRRFLLHRNFRVKFVQNFTDVDDKIINRSKSLGISPRELAEKYIAHYHRDFEELNILRADVYPRATEHIAEMLDVVKTLVDKKHAYVTPTGVYYSVSTFPGYGKLSKKTIVELKAGARVEVDPTKHDPLDFALWKFSEEEPNWESPWGSGRPGWHIECSAMSLKHLGERVDIHGGGSDLIFPHHENEIAQSEACTGQPLAKTWMHVGLVRIAEEKMSKSLGNIFPVHEALRRWGSNTIRLYCISSHYRNPLEYTERSLENALENWRLIENAYAELVSAVKSDPSEIEESKAEAEEILRQVEAALSGDFNTPVALSHFYRLARIVNRSAAEGKLSAEVAKVVRDPFERMMWIFGLRIEEFSNDKRVRIDTLVAERSRLRAEKKFSEADEIRSKLRARGIELTDYPDRTVWRRTSSGTEQSS